MLWERMQRWMEPDASVTDVVARYQIRLIASIILFVVPIGLATVVVVWFRESPEPWIAIVEFLGIGLMGLLLPLTRGRHYRYAVFGFIAMSQMVLFFLLISKPEHAVVNSCYLVIPVMVGSVFLGGRFAAVVTLINVVVVFGMGLFVEGLGGLLSTRILAFQIVVNGIAVFAGIYQDRFSKRKQADLKAREERQRALLVATFDGTAYMQDGLVVHLTDGFAELFGIEQKVGLKMSLTTLFPADQMEEVARVLQDEQGRLVELRATRSDGREFPVEVVFQRQMTHETAQMLLAIRDISERREVLAQMLVTDRMAAMGTLATGIAHEINNPLTYAAGNVQWLLERLESGGEMDMEMLKERLVRADEGATRVGRIVGDLTTFARVEENDRLVPTEVEDVLDTSIALAFSTYKHRTTLIRDHEPDLVVLGDSSRLGQVLVNLVLNAAQAMPEETAESNEIRVNSYEEDGEVLIEVSDNGPGIPSHILPRIFEPFYTTKPVGVGTGLGLYICKNLVERMDGTLEVETTEGAGTLFRIRLQSVEKDQADTEVLDAGSPVPVSEKKVRILVVDDEEDIGNLLKDVLFEHDVEVSLNGVDALQRIQRQPYELILCDLMMPQMTGMELYNACVGDDQQLGERFIFLSGGAVTVGAQEFLHRVPQPRLSKPFSPTLLRETVAMALQE